MTLELENQIQSWKKEITKYEMTLNIVKIFGHEMTWDKNTSDKFTGSCFWCGRRMQTSENNKQSPDTEITPDIVIEFINQQGIIAEIKNSLPSDKEHWTDTVDQLIKYDDTLSGWYLENNNGCHDIVLLVPYHLSIQVKEYFQQEIQNGNISFQRKFSAVSFVRDSDRGGEYFDLCLLFGEMSNQTKAESLRQIVAIPAWLVLPRYEFRYYDDVPPLPYVMDDIWLLLASYIGEMDMGSSKGINNIEFTSEKVLDDLRAINQFPNGDHRNPTLPKAKWVKEALNKLADFKFISRGRARGSFILQPKKYRNVKGSLGVFTQKLSQEAVEIEDKSRQQSLFNKL